MAKKKYQFDSKIRLMLLFVVVLIIALIFLFFWHGRADAPDTNKEKTGTGQATSSPVTSENSALTTLPKNERINAPVLMYHHIGPLPADADNIRVGLTVSTDKFDSDIKTIKDAGYQFLTLSAMYDLAAKNQLPPKAVVLTFDDGYTDNNTYALPILKKYGAVGTFFIISGMIGIPDHMGKGQIEQLIAAGNEIGSHTKTHPDLTKISSTKLEDEVSGSKTDLEKAFNIKIVSFCYPSGAENPTVINSVKSAGYLLAVTTKKGRVFSTGQMFEIPRYRESQGSSISNMIK